jgi:sugar/nucleoside kinase (ribokinase family)
MTKSYDVAGVCNALVDLFADVSNEQFDALGFPKGTMRLVEANEQTSVLKQLGATPVKMQSGGSVANSLIAVAQLGGKSAMMCSLSDDSYGKFFLDECVKMGIHLPGPLKQGGASGTCLSLITPDAERTMRTNLGVAIEVGLKHINQKTIADSSWLFLEGYVFSNSDDGRAGLLDAIRIAQETDTKVAVTCSEPWVVSTFSEPLWKALSQADLVFANEEEAAALSGATDIKAAGESLSKKFPHVVITAGPRGAYLWWHGEHLHVPAFPCEPRDLTGAGDMFAGAFLYGITHGYSPGEAATRACFLARDVISQVGARLTGDVKSRWAEALRSAA